jgi:NAD(P)-dependent dehydrogenase (short-subunit alcohol dehydrogenase family)
MVGGFSLWADEAALEAATVIWAKDLAGTGVTVNAPAVGRTADLDSLRWRDWTPLHRQGWDRAPTAEAAKAGRRGWRSTRQSRFELCAAWAPNHLAPGRNYANS